MPAAVLGHVPYGILTFGLFGAAKKEISDRFPDMRRGAVTILSALLADAVGSIWLAPMEVIKLKLQTGVHGSFANALRSGGLYNGLLAQSLRDAPFRALNMLAYDTVREQMSRRMGRDVSGVEGITLGACVGGVVGAVTTPMDVVKTRVMSQRAGWGKCYGGWIGCAKKTIRGEGVAGLFRGVGCRTVYMAASVALFAVAYEQGRKWREEIKVAKRQ